MQRRTLGPWITNFRDIFMDTLDIPIFIPISSQLFVSLFPIGMSPNSAENWAMPMNPVKQSPKWKGVLVSRFGILPERDAHGATLKLNRHTTCDKGSSKSLCKEGS